MKRVPLASIDLDTSIQCRAAIDMGVVSEYAERMEEGDKFPPVTLFSEGPRFWIGDGWHRVLAGKRMQAVDIEAEILEGGRTEALKYALRANAAHGHRRTNADKRRAVELALDAFPQSSSRAIAELCAVSDPFVLNIREAKKPADLLTNSTFKVTGRDGKQYDARRPRRDMEDAVIVDLPRMTPPATVNASPGAEVAGADDTEADGKEDGGGRGAERDYGVELRRAWKAAGKADRERFCAWVDKERAGDLPKSDYREIHLVVRKLERMVKTCPHGLNEICNVFGLQKRAEVPHV